MVKHSLVGTWRLVAWENRDAQGQVTWPVGHAARGYIMYTADGYMSVQIMTANRPLFAADDLLTGSSAEKAGAAETYIAYAGRYERRANTVIHHVELSLFPNWVGTQQERLLEVSGDRLILSTAPLLLGGKQQTAHLIWERVSSAQGTVTSPSGDEA